MRSLLLTPVLAAWLVGCGMSGPPMLPPAADAAAKNARVRSFLGRMPPEIAPDARWLDAPPSSLAALRGRVVYVQFAFPT